MKKVKNREIGRDSEEREKKKGGGVDMEIK